MIWYTTHAQVLANNIFITTAAELASLEQPQEHPCSNEDMQITLNTCVAKTYTQLDVCIPLCFIWTAKSFRSGPLPPKRKMKDIWSKWMCIHTTCSYIHKWWAHNASTFQAHTNMHPCTPMHPITHTQSLAPLPLSLATHNTQAQLHSQVMCTHNANFMHTTTNLCSLSFLCHSPRQMDGNMHTQSLPPLPQSLTTHPCTHHTQHTSIVTLDLLPKKTPFHFSQWAMDCHSSPHTSRGTLGRKAVQRHGTVHRKYYNTQKPLWLLSFKVIKRWIVKR